MRIIEIVKELERVTIHKECGAKIGFYSNEIHNGGVVEDYGGGRDTYWFIVCPNCGKQVEVDRYEKTGRGGLLMA